MKIVIPGGSGQVGTLLARAFQEEGHQVIVLSRTPHDAPWRVVKWDAKSIGPWVKELDGADAIINLAGRSVNCRYTIPNRHLIKESRVDSTVIVGQAIAQCVHPPRVWLQASTATIYAHRYDAPNDETTGILGGDEPNAPDTWRFSIDVAKSWEAAALQTKIPQTRQVLLRSAMVMSPDRGGVFRVLLGLVRGGLGGTQGDGRQYLSWIHDHDFIKACHFLIERDDISGPVNLCAPEPVQNRAFMEILRRTARAKFGLHATRWMLEIGAAVLKTETELILKSRRVVPTRLLAAGFTFTFPTWKAAARDLCQRSGISV